MGLPGDRKEPVPVTRESSTAWAAAKAPHEPTAQAPVRAEVPERKGRKYVSVQSEGGEDTPCARNR